MDEQRQFHDRTFAAGTLGTLGYVIAGLRTLPGRKAVILFSDGFRLYNSPKDVAQGRAISPLILEQFRKLTDLANRAAVVMYTIDPRGIVYTGIRAEDHVRVSAPTFPRVAARINQDRQDILIENFEGLAYLAEQTGGLAWKNTNDLAAAAREAIADQNGYYLCWRTNLIARRSR